MFKTRIPSLPIDLKHFKVKNVGTEVMVEVMGLIPYSKLAANFVSLDDFARIQSGAAFVTFEAAQSPLPMIGNSGEPHPNQMGLADVDPGDAPRGHLPEKVFIRLLSMPTDATQLKKAETLLKKITGFKKLDDLREEIRNVSPDRPVTLRNADGGDLFLRMDAVTIIADLHERGATADWIAHDVPAEETPASVPGFALRFAPEKITMDRLTVGSQWILKAAGTQVRIYEVAGGMVSCAALFGVYQALPAWIFAMTVEPAESIPALDELDLGQFVAQAPAEIKIDPETEAKVEAGPILLTIAEVPLGATVSVGGLVHFVASAKLDEDEGKIRPVAVLVGEDGVAALAGLGELVEIVAVDQLSPLVYNAIAEAAQEPQEGAGGSLEDVRGVEGVIDLPADEQEGSGESQEGGADLELLDGGIPDDESGAGEVA